MIYSSKTESERMFENFVIFTEVVKLSELNLYQMAEVNKPISDLEIIINNCKVNGDITSFFQMIEILLESNIELTTSICRSIFNLGRYNFSMMVNMFKIIKKKKIIIRDELTKIILDDCKCIFDIFGYNESNQYFHLAYLNFAIIKGHLQVFKYIIENNIPEIGKDPFHRKHLRNSFKRLGILEEDITEYIIDSHNARYVFLHTFKLAVVKGKLEIVKYLVENHKVDPGKYIAAAKVALANNQFHIADYFIKKNALIDNSFVVEFIENGRLDVIQYLVQNHFCYKDADYGFLADIAGRAGQLEIEKCIKSYMHNLK